jgi:hypothetical protein
MTIALGNRQRACLGGLVLGALLLLGHNGLQLTRLLDPGLSGYPTEIRGIRSQWGVLEQMRSLGVAEAEAENHVDLDRVLAKLLPDPDEKTWEPSSTATTTNNIPPPGAVGKARVRLPKLTGIVKQSDRQGGVRSIAIFEGEVHSEMELVWGFTIEQISQEGVLLTQGSSRWFIPAPRPSFSVVRPEHDSSPARNAEEGSGEAG